MVGYNRTAIAVAVWGLAGVPVAIGADNYQPPAASQLLLKDIDFTKATLIDEFYRAEFKACDDHNLFHGKPMLGSRKCHDEKNGDDKNNGRALLKLANGANLIPV